MSQNDAELIEFIHGAQFELIQWKTGIKPSTKQG
jgi:hypothetical protein